MDCMATVDQYSEAQYLRAVEMMRDCLTSWSNNRGIDHIGGTPITVKQLSNEDIVNVFGIYCQQIREGQIAGMPDQWRNLFLSIEQETVEVVVLSKV